ncbi:OmpA family protein [uncultured Sneathiella sp.]|jgi:outer membrane protein OmpA-like peptidoglycan-associated protein|uniref:OmpA family protein n=1 Tax=uncultured Sneathiella sp. TaxID=879315 RepID=UPI002594D85C|nr:OmpA family protein [uncultured Sneathiella sp.]
MKNMFRFAIVGAASLVLAACGGKLEQAERLSPSGTEFQQALYTGYIELAKAEYNEGDYIDSDRFAEKAMAATRGEQVDPYHPEEWRLPTDREPVLMGARERLMDVLNAGAGEKLPMQAARAQTSFDCWVQEQEENRQPKDIAACRDAFVLAMEEIEAAMAPVVVVEEKVVVVEKKEPMMEPKSFEVNFDFDSDTPLPGSMEEVKAAAEYMKKFKDPKITIAGYTDTVGSVAYNDKLGERRAENVAFMGIDQGMEPKRIIMRSYGKKDLKVPTADGVKNAANRRVVITVESK